LIIEINDVNAVLVLPGDRTVPLRGQRQHDGNGNRAPLIAFEHLEVHKAAGAQAIPALVEQVTLVPGQVVLRLDEKRVMGQVYVGVELRPGGVGWVHQPVALVGNDRGVVEVPGADLRVVPRGYPHEESLDIAFKTITDAGDHPQPSYENPQPGMER